MNIIMWSNLLCVSAFLFWWGTWLPSVATRLYAYSPDYTELQGVGLVAQGRKPGVGTPVVAGNLVAVDIPVVDNHAAAVGTPAAVVVGTPVVVGTLVVVGIPGVPLHLRGVLRVYSLAGSLLQGVPGDILVDILVARVDKRDLETDNLC